MKQKSEADGSTISWALNTRLQRLFLKAHVKICPRDDMTKTGLKVFQPNHMQQCLPNWEATIRLIQCTFWSTSRHFLMSKEPHCLLWSHFCFIQNRFNFILGKSLTQTAAKLAVGTNMICLIVGSAWKETQWAQTACRSLYGPVTQRTEKLKQANKACLKHKVNTFILFSQRTTFHENFKYTSASKYTFYIFKNGITMLIWSIPWT